MDFENVSRCNLRCTMCQVSEWEGGKRAADMTVEEFKNQIDRQHGLVEIKIQGMGEPTLAKDDFYTMIRYARKKNIWVRTTTNATTLHVNDNARKLIDSGVNEVQISVDGTTAETYEKIRRGARFLRMVENCQLINSYANERGLLKTRMWTVVQKSNIAEFDRFVDFGHMLGFKRVSLALNLNDWGQDKWAKTNSSVTVEERVTEEMALKALARGKELGVDVSFWNNTSKYSHQDPKRLCPWPFERAYIASEGAVVPCCMIGTPEVLQLGDAKDFEKHWHGETYREFRRQHIEGRVPRACRNCYEPESHGK